MPDIALLVGPAQRSKWSPYAIAHLADPSSITLWPAHRRCDRASSSQGNVSTTMRRRTKAALRGTISQENEVSHSQACTASCALIIMSVQTIFRMSRCMRSTSRDGIMLILFRLSQVSHTGCCRSRTYTTLSLCRRPSKRQRSRRKDFIPSTSRRTRHLLD